MKDNVLHEIILNKCLDILKREDVKTEFKNLFTPLINIILIEIYPYIYLSLLFVIISFLLHLGIFFLLLRNKNFSKEF
tara:strand:- start:117 stop:350 length:234 start_codon:yes stop_codon:yes gene_type:complete